MKKVLLLGGTILVIPLVEALTLFGEEISMIVIIPLILIFIVLMVFISMIIKDKIKAKLVSSNLGLIDLPEPPSAEALTAEPLLIEEPLKEEFIPKTEQIQKPKTDYLREIEELERKLPYMNIENANNQVNELIKRFFLDYMGINYNFTFEELETELKKRNKKIRCFSDNLSSINYSPEGLSRENLIELIRELKDIIRADIEENQLITPEFRKEAEKKKKRMNILLEKGEQLIGKDINKARENYKEIFKLYQKLTDEEKAAIRPSIINFYNNLRF